jgi:periplasmic protein TonB
VAFESFRGQDRARPRRLRRIAFALVALFHGVLIAAGIVYSYWHVDELTPPTLRVTFMSAAAPPPPPPPPPAGGSGKPKKIALKTKTPEPVDPTPVPKPSDIVQPREKPTPVKKTFRTHEDEEEDDDDDAPKGKPGGKPGGIAGGEEGGTVGGTVGGKIGGVIGGKVGGTGPVGRTKFLPPNLGDAQKLSGDDPPFPASLVRVDKQYAVQAKICVSPAGAVDSVTIVGKADSQLADSVLKTVKTWRYRPLMTDSIPVPFCTFSRFEFNSIR